MPNNCSILTKQITILRSRIQDLQQEIETKREIQNQNDELLRFEMLITKLSSRFINLSPNDAKRQIEDGLKLLAEFLKVDSIVVGEFLNDGKVLKSLYSYCRNNIDAVYPENISEHSPWGTLQMRRGNIVIWRNTSDDIPAEAEHEKRFAATYRIKAGLFIPLMVNHTDMLPMGCISYSKPREWGDKLIHRLRLFGEIMAGAISRLRAETKLKKAHNEIIELNEKLKEENLYLREEITFRNRHEYIIGKSPGIKKVLNQVEQVAETSSIVLVSGETGTGKELIAQAIHNLSTRRKRSLVTVNCATLPATLVESELFGHERGAFTGAQTRKIGRFEIAHGSTIFLDEINALSLEMQAKLLRVLQYGTFERLGSAKTIKVDARVIAATNQDLSKEVENGSFRADLFYRLNVFPINIPPLRERLEDIPLLVLEFVKQFSKQMRKQINSVPAGSMKILKNRNWSGNVRELKNVIERAMIITKGSILTIPQLESTTKIDTATQKLDEVQRNHIIHVLEKTKWRVAGKSGAAQILDINPNTLVSRMKKLGIRRHDEDFDIS